MPDDERWTIHHYEPELKRLKEHVVSGVVGPLLKPGEEIEVRRAEACCSGPLDALEREWEMELSLRCDKAGDSSDAAWYARGVLNGIRDAREVLGTRKVLGRED